jgi:hypothetical protein
MPSIRRQAAVIHAVAWSIASQVLVPNESTTTRKIARAPRSEIHGLIDDFAREFRADFLRAGYVSFDGLLSLVHDLLRNEKIVSFSLT